MKTDSSNIKHVYFKCYQNLSQVKKAVQSINKKNHNLSVQLSILGKISENYSNDEKELTATINGTKLECEKILGNATEFGGFYNTTIGVVFIAGALTPMFLHKIDGKILGEMSTGLYGILRGLGAYQFQAETYLEALKTGTYLLIVRGFDNDLDLVDAALNKDNTL